MVPITYLIVQGAIWAAVGLLMETPRNRGRARLGFLSGGVGGVVGWFLFGSIGAMTFVGGALCAGMIAFSLRPVRAVRRPAGARRPAHVRVLEPELRAS